MPPQLYIFTQSIYNDIIETYHVCRVHNVAAILWLKLMAHVMLYRKINVLHSHISTLRSVCAVPNIAAVRSSLMSSFPGLLFGHFLHDFEMVPVAPIVTGITRTEALKQCLVFTLHIHSASIVTSFLDTLLFPELAISVETHVPFHYHQLLYPVRSVSFHLFIP
jgi:hypothetical protein